LASIQFNTLGINKSLFRSVVGMMSVPAAELSQPPTIPVLDSTMIPPVLHAIGGSVGSALALLLLYPLERARIEMQASVAAVTPRAVASDALSLPRTPPRLVDDPDNHEEDQYNPSRSHSPLSTDSNWTIAEDLTLRISGMTTLAMSSATTTDEEEAELFLDASQIEVDYIDTNTQPESDERMGALPARQTPAPPPEASNRENRLDLATCIQRLYAQGELYKGVAPIVTTLAISNFVFFGMNEYFKRLLMTLAFGTATRGARPKYHSLIASSLAGICNVCLTNPLWVANLRLVTSRSTESRPSLWKELQNIAKREGLGQLWNGTGTSILLVSNPVIQFVLYERLKSLRLLQKQGMSSVRARPPGHAAAGTFLSPLEAFLLGALSKAVATIVTYPLQLAQAVLRLQQQQTASSLAPASRQLGDGVISAAANAGAERNEHGLTSSPMAIETSSPPYATSSPLPGTAFPIVSSPQHYRGTMDCLYQLYKRENYSIRGWFTGMRAKMLQTVLTAAFTFLTYEQILHVLVSLHRQFLLASSSQETTRLP
jgi:solute carrier family 25 (peroxisomal adenine nucleotide transporter), member 17